jgi:hypothetical protein
MERYQISREISSSSEFFGTTHWQHNNPTHAAAAAANRMLRKASVFYSWLAGRLAGWLASLGIGAKEPLGCGFAWRCTAGRVPM